jgi:hypothetical protein
MGLKRIRHLEDPGVTFWLVKLILEKEDVGV